MVHHLEVYSEVVIPVSSGLLTLEEHKYAWKAKHRVANILGE